MIRFMSLSSGSCGNCYFLGTESSGILIDAGVSLRSLKKGLEDAGLSLNSFSSVLITHDHADHVRHLGAYCKKLSRPVHTTALLHGVFSRNPYTREFFPSCGRILESGKWNDINGFKVRFFIVPHDAEQTVGYCIQADGHAFMIMSDAGRVTDEALNFARQAHSVVIESNYDYDMLMNGDYPYDLKMRIRNGYGHLSNDDCATAITRFIHPSLKNIFLCHLSENNNRPELAFERSSASLAEVWRAKCESESKEYVEAQIPSLHVLPRANPSELFILD